MTCHRTNEQEPSLPEKEWHQESDISEISRVCQTVWVAPLVTENLSRISNLEHESAAKLSFPWHECEEHVDSLEKSVDTCLNSCKHQAATMYSGQIPSFELEFLRTSISRVSSQVMIENT
jgi:hypothetical protein